MSYKTEEMANKVKVNTLSLRALFRLNLCIPDYQRGYCWEKKQVEGLLESLWYSVPEKTYHLGTVILHKHKKHKSDIAYGQQQNEYDIVDGQQRLVTLSILLYRLNAMYSSKYKKIANPLLGSTTTDIDVIKRLSNNQETITDWIRCHPDLPSEVFLFNELRFTVVTISQGEDESSSDYDSSLPLAWTFFNAVNSGGKLLSDYDLLKAHHLRYLSSKKRDDSLIQYKAGIWDSNGEQKVNSFYGEKLNLYEISFAHTFYLIRSWLKNRSITVSDLPADSRYCILHHYSALLSIPHADEGGGMTGLTDGVIGGEQFFDWTEYWMWWFRLFCKNPVVKSFNEVPWAWPQRHLRIIARALLFYYFSKFGSHHLADACIFILYRIGRLRNTSARKKNAWYGNDHNGDKCAPHTIAAIEESPTPEYFFQYCQMPSNRYVRHYNLKDITKNKDNDWLKKFNLGPDWWKRFLTFAASPDKQIGDSTATSSANNKHPVIPIPSDTPRIGDSIYYKEQIALLLNDAAGEFGWEYAPQTLELKYKD